MTPCRWDGKQLGIWHVLDFEAVVFHLEVQIGFAGHDQGFGCDRPQCRVKITVEYRIGSDVRVLPGPQMSEQVVRVAPQKIRFPRHHEKILE